MHADTKEMQFEQVRTEKKEWDYQWEEMLSFRQLKC